MASSVSTHDNLALIFGILGNVISFMVFLAPLPTFYRIFKKKSTEEFQSLPYLVALFSCVLWLYYASLKKDVILLITINSFGCGIEIIYILMYIIYANKDARWLTIKLFMAMNVGLFALIFCVTNFALHGSLRVKVLGWICVSISVSVFAAPLSIMAQVIRTKSVEFMPFNLSLFLTLSAIMWFGYGAFIKDICIAIPNVVGFALGVVQMVLYGIYRNNNNGGNNKGYTKKEHKALDLVTNVVIELSPKGTNEIIVPIPSPITKDHRVMKKNNNNNNNHEDDDEKNVRDIETIV
ncbi:hypothetical protein HN51_014099 [Arachis hypogaea]|uniref:bidirectional sugar transporter N3-like n=1 Tax=Arachis ipaensis TaxID=130454 RepID=UPI0007AF3338|nr:bidirectional sugar transporter N3-like [Arachis ipaensis]XP_025639618.1 bidirectional sugar transporter N3 [Arachis hypogaea]QHO59975.1 Bidirectional sugar transporter [Arachis hypogaea]